MIFFGKQRADRDTAIQLSSLQFSYLRRVKIVVEVKCKEGQTRPEKSHAASE
jgi:hypothetical protein